MVYVVCVCVCVCVCVLSHVQLFATPWMVAHYTPLSMGFPRQEYWSRLPFPTPEDLPKPRIEPTSLASPALAGRFFITSATWEAHAICCCSVAQLCPTLCDLMDHTVHGVLQTRILEWVSLSLLQGIFSTQGSNPGLPTNTDTKESGAWE